MPQQASWSGTPSIKGSSESMRMALLTFTLAGLQFTWGIEMTYCTPYLLSLGLTKSRTSLVWIAGPLSGLVMQPIVGVFSDRSKSRWGRRRPFMVAGAVIVGACLLTLGWASEVAGFFVPDEKARKSATIALAILCIYAVDFAINAVQSACRSLIVDTLPIPKQQLGSAWASRMVGIGHLVGYGAGTINLPKLFGTTLGDTQFKQLTVIAAFSLLFTVAVTCYSVEERVLISGKDSDAKSGAWKTFKMLLRTTMHLPRRIQAICWVQFWAWIGWFPFLFYGTTWVGETYLRYDAPLVKEGQKSTDALGDIGRVGSSSLVAFSIITLAGSVVLPLLIQSPDEDRRTFTPRPPASIAPIVSELAKYKPDLATAWMLSHFIFAGAMSLAPFTRSFRFATVLVSFCGLSSAVASWAPFAFMGIEINKLGSSNTSGYRRLSMDRTSTSLELELEDRRRDSISSVLELNHAPGTGEVTASTGELAGVYLGILNLFTTLPQFLGTFISMIVFSVLEPGKSPELATGAEPHEVHSTDGPNAIAVCLFIGAISAVVAAYATKKLKYL